MSLSTHIYSFSANSLAETLDFGRRIGAAMEGGEVLELVSDLGGGKTALVRGIAKGIDSLDQVMSPTFTVSRIYQGSYISLHHFDFYRLNEPGVMAAELEESLSQARVSVAIEWSDIVASVLPRERLRIEIKVTDENSRQFDCDAWGDKHVDLLKRLS